MLMARETISTIRGSFKSGTFQQRKVLLDMRWIKRELGPRKHTLQKSGGHVEPMEMQVEVPAAI